MAVRQRCIDESPSSYGACCPGEWLWVDYNGADGKPTFHRRTNQSWFSKICNHFQEIAAWSWKLLTMITVFWEKDPLRANFQKIIPKGFTTSQNHVLCANFVKFGWPEISKVVRCLPDKKTSARSPLHRSRPKSVRASSKQYTLEFPKFHPNPFTSGRVIVETRHKAFPILGEMCSDCRYMP